MAARLVCDGRIQAINHSVSSSKRTAQVAAATPTNSRIVSARQMVPALTPALLSARARARDVSMAAVAPTEAGAPVNPLEGEPEWIALIANADFMFNGAQNEALAEQLRELRRYYGEVDREVDFFFVSEPAWLDKFPETKKVQRPCVALVSTDKKWMTFMKLRLDRVLKLDLGPMSIDDATKNTVPVPEFKPPANWTAPYAPYAPGWWEKFMRNPL